jgi:putative endonuclease
MWFSRKQSKPTETAVAVPAGQVTTKRQGDEAESLARAYLERQGLRCLAANFRTPGRGGGEIDLIMRDGDTLVFVEVRQRSGRGFGGAGASVSAAKRRRVVLAAQHYLLRLPKPPPCRFDVLLIEGALRQDSAITWLRAAFDAS